LYRGLGAAPLPKETLGIATRTMSSVPTRVARHSGLDETKVEIVMILVAFVALLLVVAAFWVIPRTLVRMAAKAPSRVPQEWVEEYDTKDQ
jgi:hypothetical protein